jgi:NAD(P)-dependent dehydrogenase (short-subunit alcohol dehydrogenase family)
MSPKWTATHIARQDGRTAIVTGANSGIGLEAARELARAGARVVLACRNLDKGRRALLDIQNTVPGANIEIAPLDLGSLTSIREFADRFSTQNNSLDLLVNNAGVMAPPRQLTSDGFELQIGTNHLGHFALTAQLISLMADRPDARVVNVSSGAHRGGRIAFDDLHGERSYGRWRMYGQSKLANLLFTFELDRRLRAASSTIRSMAGHPGYAATNLQFAVSPPHEAFFMSIGNRILAQSAAQGALPTLYAATHPDLESGAYVGPDGMFEMRGNPKLVDSSVASRDEAAAKQLWDISEELTSVRFSFTANNAPAAEATPRPPQAATAPQQAAVTVSSEPPVNLKITYPTDAEGNRRFHMPEEARTAVLDFIHDTAAKSPAKIAAIVQAGHDAVLRSIAGLTDAQAQHKPSADDWSVLETMGHIVTVKRVMAALAASLATGELPPGFGPQFEEERAQDGFIAATFTTVAEARDAADAAHRDLLAVIEKVDDANTDVRFKHFFFGAMNAREWCCFQRIHDGDHAPQIAKIIASAGFPAT